MKVRNGNKFDINLLLCVQLVKVSFLNINGWKSVVLVARLLDVSVHMNTVFSQFCSSGLLDICSALGSHVALPQCSIVKPISLTANLLFLYHTPISIAMIYKWWHH